MGAKTRVPQRLEFSQASVASDVAAYSRGIVDSREAMRSASTKRAASRSAATKLRSFLLSERHQLRETEVFLVEAPASEARLAGRRRSVGVRHFDQSVAPAVRQGGGLKSMLNP